MKPLRVDLAVDVWLTITCVLRADADVYGWEPGPAALPRWTRVGRLFPRRPGRMR